MTAKDIITLIIAGYAAVLSTLNFVLQRRDKQARLVVSVRIGMLGTSRGHLSDPLLILSGRNRGDKELVATVPDRAMHRLLPPGGTNQHRCSTSRDSLFTFSLTSHGDEVATG